MIQVIPFTAELEPDYLPLLARGLSDLAGLRFNTYNIEAQVNLELANPRWTIPIESNEFQPNWQGQELWFTGKLTATDKLHIDLLLYDPQLQQIVYHDGFQAESSQFLSVWENHMQRLLNSLREGSDDLVSSRRMFTLSLESFLAFRAGLEILAQAKNQRRREEGLESLLKAVAYDPDFIEAADILMFFLVQNDSIIDFDRSVAILENLRQLISQHPRVPLVLAEIYFLAGKNQKSEDILKELTETFPRFLEGFIRLALYYQAENRTAEALALLDIVLDQDPRHVVALDLAAALNAATGETVKAEQLWDQALDIDDSRVNILSNLALLAEEAGELDKAEQLYEKAIAVDAQWWGTYFNYGAFCRRQQRFEEAEQWLAKAVNLNPSHLQSIQNLALTQIELRHYNEAQESLLNILRLAPDNTARREALELLEQLDSSEAQIELRLRQLGKTWETGKHWPVIRKLCWLFFKAKHNWYYWYLLGRTNERGLKKIAFLCWLIGLNYNPGFPLVKKVGLQYVANGQFNKALPLLRQAFQLNQGDLETAQAYLNTLVTLGEVEELHSHVKKFPKLKSEDGRSTL